MATYKDIHGNNIPIRSSNPSNPITGEIWYNTTSNELKGQIFRTSAVFTSGGALPCQEILEQEEELLKTLLG